MTDSTTEVAHAAQELLEPGEELLAGLAAHPPHSSAPTPGADTSLVRTGVGGLVMGELLDCYHASTLTPTGDASEVPSAFHFWIALTSARLLFFEGGVIARLGAKLAPEGSARTLHSEIALADVLAIEPLGALEDERLELRFADGSRSTVICAHAGEGQAFRAAFADAKRAAAG
jgi:hypothetical protein